MRTKQDINNLQLHVLAAINDMNSPLGAGNLQEILMTNGIVISEAGIGRLLRDLRVSGYLDKIGFQGHVITNKGLEYLNELNKAKQLDESLKNLMNQSGPLHGFSLSDVLVARRALEREAAFQAALNASDEEIARLEEIIKQQSCDLDKNEKYTDLSTSFHTELINISGVPLLKQLYEFIGLSLQWQKRIIGAVNKIYAKPLKVTHQNILNAIKEREPEKAARLIGEHLTYIMVNNKKSTIK